MEINVLLLSHANTRHGSYHNDKQEQYTNLNIKQPCNKLLMYVQTKANRIKA